MPFLGNTTTSFNVDGNNINNGAITSEKIAAGAVVNADVNDTASIAGTKISADFGAQDLIVDTNLLFVDVSEDRIGVGTSSPQELLHIGGATNKQIRMDTGSSPVYIGGFSGQLNLASNRRTVDGSIIDSTRSAAFVSVVSSTGASSISFATASAVNTTPTVQAVIDGSGRLGVGTTSPQRELHVQGATNGTIRVQAANDATSQLLFSDSDAEIRGRVGYFHTDDALDFYSAGQERMRIDSSGRLLVGTTSAADNLRFDQKLAVVSTGDNNLGGAAFVSYPGTATDFGSFIDLSRSRGNTDGSVTSVANGDTLGWLIFRGSDGSGFVNSAYIKGTVDGTPGTDDVPGRLGFFTADAGVAPTERLRITSDGTVQLRSSPGIDFSNIQTNAGGMTSETLDHYEEGIWTPSAFNGNNGATTTVNASSRAANYVRIGKLVYVSAYFNCTKGTNTGNFEIHGLPFGVDGTNSAHYSLNVAYFSGLASNVSAVMATAQPGSSHVLGRFIPSGHDDKVSVVTGGVLGTGTVEFMFAGCYRTSA